MTRMIIETPEFAIWQKAIYSLYRNSGYTIATIAAESKLGRTTVYRTCRAQYLPALNIAMAIVRALNGDGDYFARLWEDAARSQDKYMPPQADTTRMILNEMKEINTRLNEIMDKLGIERNS